MDPFLSALADRLDPPQRYRWTCDKPTCDGTPHDTWTYKHARTEQRTPPGTHWWIWLLLCGRAWGKTHTGAQTFADWILTNPKDEEGRPTWWLMAGPRYEDDTVKILWEGPSGLRNALDQRGVAWTLNKNEHSIRLTTGQIVVMQHGEYENLGRGGNWAGVWLDEPGMYKRIKAAWAESLVPSVRALVPNWRPRILLTTTAKVRIKDAHTILRNLVTSTDGHVVVTRGRTEDNAANIPPTTLEAWRQEYPAGTRLRRQELDGELLDEVEGAQWQLATIDANRATETPPTLTRVVVAVDPAATNTERSDHTGIVAAAAVGRRLDRHYYVLRDASLKASPDGWGRAAIQLWANLEADAIVYETNQGGEMVRSVLTTAARDLLAKGDIKTMPKLVPVRATRGKAVRAEPIAALYTQGRVHHIGDLSELENELCTWVPGEDSPDRLDACVWALTNLSEAGSGTGGASFQ